MAEATRPGDANMPHATVWRCVRMGSPELKVRCEGLPITDLGRLHETAPFLPTRKGLPGPGSAPGTRRKPYKACQ